MQPFHHKYSLAIRKQLYIRDYIVKTIAKILLVLLFFLAGIISAMAQNYTVTGQVTDSDGLPVYDIPVFVFSTGFFGDEIGDTTTDINGNYELEFSGDDVTGGIDLITISIIDCFGEDLSTSLSLSSFPPGGYSDIDFTFCDNDIVIGDGICSADFTVVPAELFPFIPSSDSHILLASYANGAIDGSGDELEVDYNWTINDEEIEVENIPFLPYDFEEGLEYQICLTVESEDCNVFNCETINIVFGPSDNYGCTEPDAINYDPEADFNDGSCEYECAAVFEVFPAFFGSGEYNFIASFPDEEMESNWQISAPGFEDSFESNSPFFEYTFPASAVYQICLTVTTGDCSDTFCEEVSVLVDGSGIAGCIDPFASNFNPFATEDDGSCYYTDEVFCGPGQQMITLEITTDEFPDDIEWSIYNAVTGEVYLSNSALGPSGINFPYLPHQTYIHELCIPEGEAAYFHINDAANDGLCCSYGLGGFELSACGFLLFEGADFGSDFIGLIESCEEGEALVSGCTDNTAINYDPEATWDDGSCTFATGDICEAEFFVLPIAISEEVLTIFVGDTNPDAANEWSWTVDGLTSNDAFDYFVLDGYGTYEICLTTNNGVCDDTTCQEITFSASEDGLLEFDYVNLGSLNFNFSSQAPAGNFNDLMRFKWTIDDRYVFYGHDFNFTFPEAGTYDVCLELISEESGILFEHCEAVHAFGLGVGEEDDTLEPISLYPNPTSHNIRLKNAQNIAQIRVINTNGQIVLQQGYTGQEIQVSSLPTGIYILELIKDTAEREFIRFSKQ